MFESHAHSDDEAFNEDRESLLSSMKDNGIEYIVNVSSDFESIDPAIVPVTGLIPLNHIVTQCSIIKTDNYYDMKKPDNMLCDPKDITIDWFKCIIKHLYEGDNAWYIVYNKAFEANRLHEIDVLIAEPEYHEKIKNICERGKNLWTY